MPGARPTVSLGGLLGRIGVCVAIGSAIGAMGGQARAGDSGAAKSDPVALGYEIFNREWLPDDSRSHGGDGLGPVYNDTSCVACHNSGGSGGAGPVSKNIDILSASRGMVIQEFKDVAREAQKDRSAVPIARSNSPSFETLADRHGGFRTSRTVVLHKFGTDPNYDSWRSRAFSPPAGQAEGRAIRDVLIEGPGPPVDADIFPTSGKKGGTPEDSPSTRAAARIQEIRSSILANNPGLRTPPMSVGQFAVSRSQRNPTPLFGLGLIDAIPDRAIEKLAIEEARTSPDTKGRASRLKDGRIGRLGWKGQTANTEDFVLNACAVELGLEVPGRSQAVIPQAPKYRSPGLDLNADECAALVSYVRSLPRPVERRPSNDTEARHTKAGKALFASVGCTNCHAAKVGDVEGIYSDLLLHDMGDDLGDDGSYDPDDPSDPDEPLLPQAGEAVAAQRSAPTSGTALRTRKGAGKREWRTPPLWGFRDSGPYLHDGRARTLEQAVALHGGQGSASAQKFFELSPRERLQVEAFLKSLVAPPSVQLARRGE